MCDFKDYKVIFEIICRYLKLRKNEIVIIKKFQIEFFYFY